MILLDTDILIDVALDRTPHAGLAGELLTYFEGGPRMAFVAWHSLSNFHCLVSPSRGKDDARDFFLDLTGFVVVAPTGTEAFRYADSLPVSDFEVALQIAAANACGATNRHPQRAAIPHVANPGALALRAPQGVGGRADPVAPPQSCATAPALRLFRPSPFESRRCARQVPAVPPAVPPPSR